eukprot:4302657-Ditylum_brightwellii.AAC.1
MTPTFLDKASYKELNWFQENSSILKALIEQHNLAFEQHTTASNWHSFICTLRNAHCKVKQAFAPATE